MTLKEAMSQATAEFGGNPKSINNGSCFKWAARVFDLVPGTKIAGENVDGRGHTWIEFEGRCFDSESTEGVLWWGNLPFFKRNARNANTR